MHEKGLNNGNVAHIIIYVGLFLVQLVSSHFMSIISLLQLGNCSFTLSFNLKKVNQSDGKGRNIKVEGKMRKHLHPLSLSLVSYFTLKIVFLH